MKFITLTSSPDSYYSKREAEITVNPEQIVMMTDMSVYSDYVTEIKFTNMGVLLVEETVQEIIDMIKE